MPPRCLPEASQMPQAVDSYGFLWIPKDSYGFPWIPKDSYGFLWIHMDSYGFLWIPPDSYGVMGKLGRATVEFGSVEKKSTHH